MGNRIKDITTIYGSGFLQGIALVLYPAAGSIFTDSSFHNLSSGEFGMLFTPQIIFAILSSLFASRLADMFSMQRVLQWGLGANLLSMLFFAASAFCIGMNNLPFWLLMAGTAMLGAGFGFTITALNPFAYHLFPGKEASAVTGMHIFLGLGTTVSALILNAFMAAGIWWASGLVIAILLLGMLLFQFSVQLRIIEHDSSKDIGRKSIPPRVYLYAVVIFFYAFCEATFGNWGTIYLEKEAGLTAALAALGLSIFWGAITVGRLLFTFAALRFNTKPLYLLSPLLVVTVFIMMPQLKGDFQHLSAMALGGLGLSFFFPNTISIATDEYPKYAAIISGALVAAIQLGTGVSANVIGFLNNSFTLTTIFETSAIYALLTTILVWYLHISEPIMKEEL